MSNPRSVAIWVAVLFVIGTAASVAGDVLLAPLRAAVIPLQAFAENEGRVVSAFMLFFLACVAIVAIPIVWFPILRRHSETGSVLYIATRLAEAVFFMFGALFTLSMLPLGREAASAGAMAKWLEALGTYSYTLGTMIIFSVSAILLAVMLFQTQLVPRWLSVWKGAGAILLLLQGTLIFYDTITPLLEQTLYIPIAVNEMVLALWLLFKGFSPEAVAELRGRSHP